MEIRKLHLKSLTGEQFAQIVEIERNCGLEPYTPDMLMECIAFLDTFACFHEGQVVGFITVNAHGGYFGGSLYVVNLNVAREFRGQGIARELMYAVYRVYNQEHEDRLVTLDVTKTNRAMVLYRRIGFQVADIPSRNGDTDVVMSMPLKQMGRNLERLINRRIRTERLELRYISPEHLDVLVKLLTDDVVKQTYMVPEFSCREEAVKLVQRLIAMSEQGERYVFGIYFGEILIGILNETESVDDRIEVGYAVLPRYHNQGFGTEALRGAIGYFFDHGFREVLAGAFEENAASIRVMVKSGMKKLDCRDEIAYRGQVHGCVYYSVKR